MRTVTGLAAVAAASWAMAASGPSLAQVTVSPPPPPAPRQVFPMIRVDGYLRAPKPGGAVLSRRASPDGDIRDWITKDDPSVPLLAKGLVNGAATLEISIDARGRSAGCRIVMAAGDPTLSEGLCDRVAPRVRMKPARDAGGAPAADTFVYSLSFDQAYKPPARLVDFWPARTDK